MDNFFANVNQQAVKALKLRQQNINKSTLPSKAPFSMGKKVSSQKNPPHMTPQIHLESAIHNLKKGIGFPHLEKNQARTFYLDFYYALEGEELNRGQ